MAMPRIWPKGYYVYLYCYPSGRPYYVGKGKGSRCKIIFHQRNNWVVHIDAKLRKNKKRTRIFLCEVPDHDASVILEKALIAQYGRRDNGTGILVNLTDGGEGQGRIKTLEERQKISTSKKGSKASPEARALMSKALLGNKRLLGHKHTDETKKKISEKGKGRKMNFSEAHIKFTSERISKLNRECPPRKGKKCSLEHRQKVSTALRAYHARIKSEKRKPSFTDGAPTSS